jgi:hypothetical protein
MCHREREQEAPAAATFTTTAIASDHSGSNPRPANTAALTNVIATRRGSYGVGYRRWLNT